MMNPSKPGMISVAHIAAGFIAVLVGYTGSAAIIFQAAHTLGADNTVVASWFWALGLGMGLTCIVLSLVYRQPILTAWSTPGAALLVTSLEGVTLAEAVGAFYLCSGLLFLTGISGLFDRLVRLLPPGLAPAMLAGVLFQFGADAMSYLGSDTLLVLAMLAVFLIMQARVPRFAVPLALAVGLVIAAMQGALVVEHIDLSLATPVWTAPAWSLSTAIGVALPLYVVTLASQNVPGIATLRAHGYDAPASPVIATTGATGLALAGFGGFSFNFAAITAAICMSPDVDPDPKQRYKAAVWAGVFYILIGLFANAVAGLFTAFPLALVAAIAGLALLGTIANSLADSLANPMARVPAILTFLTTTSGLELLGIGSAFWGLAIGIGAWHLQRVATAPADRA